MTLATQKFNTTEDAILSVFGETVNLPLQTSDVSKAWGVGYREIFFKCHTLLVAPKGNVKSTHTPYGEDEIRTAFGLNQN